MSASSKTISKLLIANRGEIACRIMRTAKTLGIRTVAVYSEADADAPHTKLADEAVRIGPAPVSESYLKADAIIEAARSAGVDAIHPGYGFLSENAEFAEAVEAAAIIFVGPSAKAIREMGDKAGAKQLMIAAGVPCVPGYQGDEQSDEHLIAEADKIGFPLMVKASAGGGGRGMRLVTEKSDLSEALSLARAEAMSAFGADHLILEKAIMRPRHVEVQVFADTDGNTIHLGERDCSVQRRHQKVVEEAPCPVMTPELRQSMGDAAVAAARAVDYVGAGTVEFLLADNGEFYFLEMNTRLQVEHPVTELITGFDLVALQLAVAEGHLLGISQQDVTLTGHAIEVRLYAEDPANDFLPVTGDIALWKPAEGVGVRTDHGIETGGRVSPYYDPMLAKIITHGATRDEARKKLIRALEDTALIGPTSNRAFLLDVLSSDVFSEGSATTAFIEDSWPDGVAKPVATTESIAIAAALMMNGEQKRSHALAGRVSAEQLGWRSDGMSEALLTVVADGAEWALRANPVLDGWRISGESFVHEVDLSELSRGLFIVDHERMPGAWNDDASNDTVSLSLPRTDFEFSRLRAGGLSAASAASGFVSAPMPGLLVELNTSVGDKVSAGDTVAVVEAMKMRHRVLADISGTVEAVSAEVGKQLSSGDLIVQISSETE